MFELGDKVKPLGGEVCGKIVYVHLPNQWTFYTVMFPDSMSYNYGPNELELETT